MSSITSLFLWNMDIAYSIWYFPENRFLKRRFAGNALKTSKEIFSEQLYSKFIQKYLLNNETKSYNGITEACITLSN